MRSCVFHRHTHAYIWVAIIAPPSFFWFIKKDFVDGILHGKFKTHYNVYYSLHIKDRHDICDAWDVFLKPNPINPCMPNVETDKVTDKKGSGKWTITHSSFSVPHCTNSDKYFVCHWPALPTPVMKQTCSQKGQSKIWFSYQVQLTLAHLSVR